MLKKLSYHVRFVIGGKPVDFMNSLDFEEGMTAVTGRNGKGKSLTIEMAQFALFGSSALRGKSEDYKNLTVSLVFEIKGTTYNIDRSLKDAKLHQGATPIAAGTKPVNQEILRLFGYSYDVFQVANVANQGSIEKLGSMRPTERKKMVDETIGLNVLDDLEKFVSEFIRELNGEISGIESTMVEPGAPIKPDDYLPSSELFEILTILRKKGMELEFLQREAAKPLPAIRYAGECAYNLNLLEDYEESQKQRSTLQIERDFTSREFDKIPAATYSSADLDLWWKQCEQLQLFNSESTRKTQLMSSIATMEKAKVRFECPKCQHEWFDEDSRLAGLKKQLEEFVLPVIDFEMPPLNAQQILAQQKNLGLQQRREELHTQYLDLVQQLEAIPDRTVEISSIRAFKVLLGQQERDQEEYDKVKKAVDGAKGALTLPEYQGIVEKVAKTEFQYSAALSYEALEKSYVQQKETYEGLVRGLAEKKEEKVSWEGVKKAITALRAKIKGYLIPSLNTVASNLINQMTGGELPWIVVNEDFDITVAGQRLETLSGSGKAVANLSLRIALGQVLTNKVFSVLMLDEIDASCDDTRAQYIAACVRRLTDTIKQVILISHKQGVEADQYVRL